MSVFSGSSYLYLSTTNTKKITKQSRVSSIYASTSAFIDFSWVAQIYMWAEFWPEYVGEKYNSSASLLWHITEIFIQIVELLLLE